MGLFGGRSSEIESNIDAFISQKILLPQIFLKPAENEEHFRIYGHALYEANRLMLLRRSVEEGAPFWQGKVFLKCREAIDRDVGVPKSLGRGWNAWSRRAGRGGAPRRQSGRDQQHEPHAREDATLHRASVGAGTISGGA